MSVSASNDPGSHCKYFYSSLSSVNKPEYLNRKVALITFDLGYHSLSASQLKWDSTSIIVQEKEWACCYIGECNISYMYKYVIALTQGCSDSFEDFVDFSIRINISVAACFGVDELSINGNLNVHESQGQGKEDDLVRGWILPRVFR